MEKDKDQLTAAEVKSPSSQQDRPLPFDKAARQITKNAVLCKTCGDVIESKTSNDWVTCSCGACGVDGGLQSLRRLGSVDACEELSEYSED